MKKKVILSLGAIVGLGLVMASSQDASAASANELYRLYNPNSGEHFYTLNAGERDGLVKAGWNNEGVGWYTPEKGDTVYRLYNPNAGDHHYTENKGEYDNLVKIGWTGEGESFKSDTAKTVPVYRAYNPNAKAGAHNFTPDKGEQDGLVSKGWDDEGIGFYGVNKDEANVDKEELTKLVTDLKTVNDNYKDYTTSTYNAFDNAYKAAQAVVADENATQEQVTKAATDLNAANAGLAKRATDEEREAFKNKLNLKAFAADYARNPSSTNPYTADSYAPFAKAYEDAEKALDPKEGLDFTKADLDKIYTDLYLLQDQLTEAVNRQSLVDMYNTLEYGKEIKHVTGDNFDAKNLAKLEALLAEAKPLVENGNVAADDTSEEATKFKDDVVRVDQELRDLYQPGVADKIVYTGRLNAVVSNEGAYNATDFKTSTAWGAYQTALADAQEVLAQAKSTDEADAAVVQNDVDTTQSALITALKDGLKTDVKRPEVAAKDYSDFVAKTTGVLWNEYQASLTDAK